jgi:hypothetical protein
MSPDPVPYADFLCALAAGFFAAASFAGFFPAIGISISFWPAAPPFTPEPEESGSPHMVAAE